MSGHEFDRGDSFLGAVTLVFANFSPIAIEDPVLEFEEEGLFFYFGALVIEDEKEMCMSVGDLLAGVTEDFDTIF